MWRMFFLLIFGVSLAGRAQTFHKVLLFPRSPEERTWESQVEADKRMMDELKERLDFIGWYLPDYTKYLDRHVLYEGDAQNFIVNFYCDADSLGLDKSRLRMLGYSSLELEVMGYWEMDTAKVIYKATGKRYRSTAFPEVLSVLTDGKLRPGKDYYLYGYPAHHGHNGLIPYFYEEKPCFLLWDDERLMKRLGIPQEFRVDAVDGGISLPYNFKGVSRLVLCRYSPECYVLLLLTRPMVEMD